MDVEAVQAKYYSDKGDEFKRRKQAEVLKLNKVNIDEISGFVVYNREVQIMIDNMLNSQKIIRKTLVIKEYYYDD
ncbi:MAG: DUF4433 domain-containing protein [Nitrospirae bacterium]|nr:DUF4433 domain-containing protein [Nitrospirota bacterium]